MTPMHLAALMYLKCNREMLDKFLVAKVVLPGADDTIDEADLSSADEDN
jgi:hypothetical protein